MCSSSNPTGATLRERGQIFASSFSSLIFPYIIEIANGERRRAKNHKQLVNANVKEENKKHGFKEPYQRYLSKQINK